MGGGMEIITGVERRRRGKLEVEATSAFIPFHVVPALSGPQMQTDVPTLPDAAPDPAGSYPQRIEIVLPDGTAWCRASGR